MLCQRTFNRPKSVWSGPRPLILVRAVGISHKESEFDALGIRFIVERLVTSLCYSTCVNCRQIDLCKLPFTLLIKLAINGLPGTAIANVFHRSTFPLNPFLAILSTSLQ
jgi:hypothetical protein